MNDSHTPPAAVAPTRAAIYTHTSSYAASTKHREKQVDACREYIAAKGWVVDEEHIYNGLSPAGADDRRDFKALLCASEAANVPFQVVVAPSIRSLSPLRKVLDLTKHLRSCGLPLELANERLSSSEPTFDMLLTMYTMLDQQFSARHGERIRRGQRGRVMSGLSLGRKCLGYRHVRLNPAASPDRTMQPNRDLGTVVEIAPEEAAIVRWVFDEYVNGNTPTRIAEHLNADEASRRLMATRQALNRSLVLKILSNRMYRGEITWGKTRKVQHPKTGKTVTQLRPRREWLCVDSPHIAIVSAELWDKAEARRKAARPKFQSRVDR